jgi:hypothetical protein
METDFICLGSINSNLEKVPCAIRLKAPASVERISTHFVLLLDISESMMDNNKLENVKRCSQLIVNFLTAEDSISLITFGDNATLHLKRIKADESNKQIIKSTIEGLYCDGCTNLSAGLGYVREVCEGSTQKTGLLLLTDGNANRGLHNTSDLRRIVSDLRNSFENLSIHSVAYGDDHNADLLKAVAEDNQGSYNIVNSIEDTAFAFGETLGGLMSCAFQNVKITVPENSVIHGSYKKTTVDGKTTVHIGDVYSGTSPLILLDINSASINNPLCVTIEGMTLPDLKGWKINPILYYSETREVDIELVKLRYRCSDILKDIREWGNLSSSQKDEIPGRIDKFATDINDVFFNDNQVAMALRAEIPTLRRMYERAKDNMMDNSERVVMAQHIASINLARGFSSPAAPSRHRIRRQNAAPILRNQLSAYGLEPFSAQSDPAEHEETEDEGVTPLQPTVSAYQNTVQMQVSALMRTASQYTEI